MKILEILNLLDFDKIDKEEVKYEANRRGFIQQASSLSAKALMATIPAVALSLLPKQVKAQSSSIGEVLNFALTLEYLEDEFYRVGLMSSGLIPASDRAVFEVISLHETQHVEFLRAALGNDAVAKPNFDFTARGAFADWNRNYNTFLALSQAFEDTGERAYKGQAGNLISSNEVLTAALNIHSVEARHAAAVRTLRGAVSNMSISPWKRSAGADGLPAAIYAGEDNINQLGNPVNITGFSAAAVADAFDEPLTRQQVLDIVTPFLA